MLELPIPLVVRRTVSLAFAVFDTEIEVEGVKARRCSISDVENVEHTLARREIPVIVDPSVKWLEMIYWWMHS